MEFLASATKNSAIPFHSASFPPNLSKAEVPLVLNGDSICFTLSYFPRLTGH